MFSFPISVSYDYIILFHKQQFIYLMRFCTYRTCHRQLLTDAWQQKYRTGFLSRNRCGILYQVLYLLHILFNPEGFSSRHHQTEVRFCPPVQNHQTGCRRPGHHHPDQHCSVHRCPGHHYSDPDHLCTRNQLMASKCICTLIGV